MIALVLSAVGMAAAAPPPSMCANTDAEEFDPNAIRNEYAGVDITMSTPPAEAMEQAKELARQRLVATLGEGLPAAQRRALVSKITARQAGYAQSGMRKMACARAFVDRAYVEQVERDVQQLAENIRILAERAKKLAGDRPIYVESPLTPEGCAAGALGSNLQVRVVGELNNLNARIASGPGKNAARLYTVLDAGGAQGVSVASQVLLPGETSGEGYGFTFNPWVLVDEPLTALATAHDSCGLRAFFPEGGTSRPGADGLFVNPLLAKRALCQDDALALTVSTTKPALVQVFSVGSGATGYLTVPTSAGGQRVSPDVPWKGMNVVADAYTPPREEHLLVVAVPTATGFTGTRDWVGTCKMPGALRPDQFPAGAAMNEVTFKVSPRGEPGCEKAPPTPEIVPSEIPECGTGRMVPYP